MLTTDDLGRLGGGSVLDSEGNKIGSVGQIYLDDESGQPEWVTVNTGLFGTSESFVPLSEASAEGDDIRVPFTKDKVKGAPRVDAAEHLDRDQEGELYRYYDLSYGADRGGVDTAGVDYAAQDSGTRTSEVGTVGHDTSGPSTDDAMTRSEERLNVGTEQREAGRARLRKYVVTENQTVSVPVTREEVRIDREPITDANRGDALDGPAISEEEHEVVLREERPVVEKETVPVERVKLSKEQVTEERQVSEEVRKEQIETEGDVGGRTDRSSS